MCSKDSDERRLVELEKKQKALLAKGGHLPQEEADELQSLRISCKGKPRKNTKSKNEKITRRIH